MSNNDQNPPRTLAMDPVRISKGTPSKNYNMDDISFHLKTDASGLFSEEHEAVMELLKGNMPISLDNDHLEACLVKHCPKKFVPPLENRWPQKGAPEQEFYMPFTRLLNKCLEQTRIVYKDLDHQLVDNCAMGSLFTPNFRWFFYGRAAINYDKVAQKVDIAGSILTGPNDLEPRGVSDCLKKPTGIDLPCGEYVHWEHMISFVEVKSAWLDSIAQAVTHVRRILTSQPNRVSARFVILNTKSMSAVIAEADRGGVYMTRPYKLTQAIFYHRFCIMLAGMYCSSTDAHGYNRRLRFYKTPEGVVALSVWSGGVWLGVGLLLCNRTGYRSRCTRVFKLVSGATPSYDEALGRGPESLGKWYQIMEDDPADAEGGEDNQEADQEEQPDKADERETKKQKTGEVSHSFIPLFVQLRTALRAIRRIQELSASLRFLRAICLNSRKI